MSTINITGQTFNNWTAIERIANKDKPRSRGEAYWRCKCACGTEKILSSYSVRTGNTKSCGCLKPAALQKAKTIHGQSTNNYSRTIAYNLHAGAKARAKKFGRDFDLALQDIIVPELCPALGIPLKTNTKVTGPDSPTLDRIDNTKGYVKGNVHVLSFKANTMKNSASIQELEALLAYLKSLDRMN